MAFRAAIIFLSGIASVDSSVPLGLRCLQMRQRAADQLRYASNGVRNARRRRDRFFRRVREAVTGPFAREEPPDTDVDINFDDVVSCPICQEIIAPVVKEVEVKAKLKKNSQNFRVSREMREKNCVYDLILNEF